MFTEVIIYRELDPLDLYSREVGYHIECILWYKIQEGDGWNNPSIEATLELDQWSITQITRHHYDCTVKYKPGFIGPAEPGMTWFDDHLKLTESETDYIIQTAWLELRDD